jgi:hypothetical protein
VTHTLKKKIRFPYVIRALQLLASQRGKTAKNSPAVEGFARPNQLPMIVLQ